MQEQWLQGWCGMCLQNDCGMKIRLQDGLVTEVVGDEDCPTNKGKLCARGGLTSLAGYYDPKRLKTPLRRTNPRKGFTENPQWEAISWEEAFKEIGQRLQKIRRDDPRKFAFMEGWGVADELFSREAWPQLNGKETYGNTFSLAFGTPNMMLSHGMLCPIHFASNLVHGQHPEQIADLEYCEYLIAIGRTVGPNSVCPHSTSRFSKAMSKGLNLVVIDPRHSHEAAKAKLWLPIIPGTELAFALAMLHGILYEVGRYDVDFLKMRTNAPYLIGEDDLYVRDPLTQKPLMVDASTGKALPFDEVEEPILDYCEGWQEAGQGAEKVQTVSTGFHRLKTQMLEYTPEWAAAITSIPAEQIRQVTSEFVQHAHLGETIVIDDFEFPFRPVQFSGSGRGACSHQNGTHFDLAGKLINMLMGAVELPGALTGGNRPGPNPNILRPDADGTVIPVIEAKPHPFHFPPNTLDAAEFFPHRHAMPQLMARNILDPKKYHLPYDLELLLLAGSNPIRSSGEPKLWEQAFAKIPFVVSLAISHDETVLMSDIVLPVSHFLEKGGIRMYKPPLQSIDDSVRGLEMILARQPVPKLHDTKNADEILYALAEAGGFLYGAGGMNELINLVNRLSPERSLDLQTKYTLPEIWDRMIADTFGEDASYAKAQVQGRYSRFSFTGKKGYNYYHWPKNTTRHPFYFERLPKTAKSLKASLAEHGLSHPGYSQDEQFFEQYVGTPRWFPIAKHVKSPADYDLYAINWKTPFRMHGTGGNIGNPWLNELREQDPYELYIHINTQTAKTKGLSDGQLVLVESLAGKTTGKLRLTELIHPQVIGIPGNYGGLQTDFVNPVSPKGGAWFNALLGCSEEDMDPISGGLEISPKVRLKPMQNPVGGSGRSSHA